MIETIDTKLARTKYNVIDVIRRRWSPRSFRKEALLTEELNTLLEAASWAPSAMNEQPWRFVVASRDDSESFPVLESFLMPGNRVWASNAAALVIVLGISTYARNGKTNINMAHDVGMATQNMLLQATAMDIYGHVMEGFDKQAVKDFFNLPENVVPLTMVAFGRLDIPDVLDEPYRGRELAARQRRQPEESMISFPEK